MTIIASIELSNNSLYYDKDIPFKCMVVFYKFLHVVFGLDFGFVEFKVLGVKYSKLPAIVHCIFVLALTGLCIYSIPAIQHIFPAFIYFVIPYFLSHLILMRIKKETSFCNLFQNLRAIDSGLYVRHSSYNLEIKFFICILIYFLYKVWLLSIFFFYLVQIQNKDSNPNQFLTFMLILLHLLVNVTTDILRITGAFMFCAINCRLNKLKLLLKRKHSGFLAMQYLYKAIVDIAEQHKESFDPVVLTSLMYNIPHAMALILNFVKAIKNVGIFHEEIRVAYFIIEMLLLTILPAICAGLLASQAKEIKDILHDLLLNQQEYDVQYRELERFISYVEARGCRFRLYKVMPLDASLFWMVISFCVTYLIVIIQFIYK